MLSPVLVTYSSRTGSTLEVAEAVVEVLRRTQIKVDVTPMSDVNTLDRYGAVILGTPIYVGKLPREVHKFINRFRIPLTVLPSWVFALGPVRIHSDGLGLAASQVGNQLARHPWFQPLEVKILGGRIDVDALPFPFNIGRRLVPYQFAGVPNADLRDWSEINTWASLISRHIKPEEARSAEFEVAPEEMPIGKRIF